ncbi:hypothetical protein ACF0H5_013888 [Mactra antiquata]
MLFEQFSVDKAIYLSYIGANRKYRVMGHGGKLLDATLAALDKVKSEFEVENGRLAIITPDRYAETYDIMGNHFTHDEPLCRSFGVVWEEEHKRDIYEKLICNVSICMISKDSNEIIGVLVNGIMKISDPPMDLSKFNYEPLRSLYIFLTHKDKEVKFFEHFGVDEAIHFFALGVKRQYRRMGLGGKLLAAAVAMSRELGFKVSKIDGVSNFSQRIIEKHGFETLCTLPYDSYLYNGHPLKDGTGEHTEMKIYGLRL